MVNDKFIKGLWTLRKIILCILIFQVAFAVVFMLIGKYENVIVNLWFGGVMVTPVGLVIGLMWEHRSDRGSLRENRSTIILTSLIILSLVAMTLLLPLNQMANNLII